MDVQHAFADVFHPRFEVSEARHIPATDVRPEYHTRPAFAASDANPHGGTVAFDASVGSGRGGIQCLGGVERRLLRLGCRRRDRDGRVQRGPRLFR